MCIWHVAYCAAAECLPAPWNPAPDLTLYAPPKPNLQPLEQNFVLPAAVEAPFFCGGECCDSTFGTCLRDSNGDIQCCANSLRARSGDPRSVLS